MLNDVFDKSSKIIKGSYNKGEHSQFVQCSSSFHLLLRIVDDFLLISTDRDTSVRFLKKLNKGIPGLGVKINREKTRVNYHVSLENLRSGKMEAVNMCCNKYKFPWCGLLIDTSTCEISLDYERFSGTRVADTVTIHLSGNDGWHLQNKMKNFVRPRCCQNLLFSSCINGLETIRLNFYQTFLLCAIKTIHYISRKNQCNTFTTAVSNHQHCSFIFYSVCETIRFAFLLISSNIKGSPVKNDKRFELAWRDALWLGKHAFFSIIRKEERLYGGLRHFFSESRDFPMATRMDLLNVSKRALKLFPLSGRA